MNVLLQCLVTIVVIAAYLYVLWLYNKKAVDAKNKAALANPTTTEPAYHIAEERSLYYLDEDDDENPIWMRPIPEVENEYDPSEDIR